MRILKENYKQLQDLIEGGTIDLNDFYTVSFGRVDIRIQGDYNAFLVDKYQRKFGNKFQIKENGFAELVIDNMTIIFG